MPVEASKEVLRTDLQILDQGTVLESQHLAGVRAVALRVGYQLPAECADPDLIQRDIAINMRRSVEACLEVGRGLVVLKEACGHGQFVARLEVLGIDRTVSFRFMQVAIKFSNVSSTQHLTKAIGNQTKLFEMLVLDDEQIEELELTGQTGELKLDDIATMSVKELRSKLREARAEGKSKDQLLADKNALLDKIAVIDPWDKKVAEFKAEISTGFDLLDDAIGKLYLTHSVILQQDVSWGGNDDAEKVILRQFSCLYGDRLKRLAQQIGELQDAYAATLAGWADELDGRSVNRSGE
jgi:hypothetical protein